MPVRRPAPMPATTLAILTLAVPALVAQQPTVGQHAPSIDCAHWLNAPDDLTPSLDALRGRAVLIEFWGTWCGPCVRSMPEVQRLHDRYSGRGLTVLAISYEEPSEMAPFLEKNGYTMTVGSDPGKAVVAAYGVRSWPSTFLIDGDGKVAWIGDPYGAEAAVEKVLGLESSPATLLTAWLECPEDSEPESRREALTRLHEKASANFDLRAWARANGGGEAPVETPDAEGEAREASATPARRAMSSEDAAKLLDRCAAVWASGDGEKRVEFLRRLAAAAPESFDLATWSRGVYAAEFPLDAKELKSLLDQKRFADVILALVERCPNSRVARLATRDDALAAWCKTESARARELAKKAIMAQGWVFAGVQPKDNDAFWSELAISGVSMSEDRKQILGVLLGGQAVTREMAAGYIRDQLARAIVMEEITAGKTPNLKQLPRRVDTERAKVLEELERRYGELPDDEHRRR